MKINVSEASMSRALGLHSYAFSLVGWLDEQAKAAPVALAAARSAVEDPKACGSWLEGQWQALPTSGRPPKDDVHALGAMLSSFFRTSFLISVDHALDGRVVAASIRHVPVGTRPHTKIRRTLETEALQRLAIDAGFRLSKDVLHKWVDVAPRHELDVWLYSVELVSRMHGRTQNLDATRLWRRMGAAERRNLEGSIRRAREALLVSIPELPDL